jgi:hypothetical protein
MSCHREWKKRNPNLIPDQEPLCSCRIDCHRHVTERVLAANTVCEAGPQCMLPCLCVAEVTRGAHDTHGWLCCSPRQHGKRNDVDDDHRHVNAHAHRAPSDVLPRGSHTLGLTECRFCPPRLPPARLRIVISICVHVRALSLPPSFSHQQTSAPPSIHPPHGDSKAPGAVHKRVLLEKEQVREAKAEVTRATVGPEPGEGTRATRHASHPRPSSQDPHCTHSRSAKCNVTVEIDSSGARVECRALRDCGSSSTGS